LKKINVIVIIIKIIISSASSLSQIKTIILFFFKYKIITIVYKENGFTTKRIQ
jgi:hypothetical protein